MHGISKWKACQACCWQNFINRGTKKVVKWGCKGQKAEPSSVGSMSILNVGSKILLPSLFKCHSHTAQRWQHKLASHKFTAYVPSGVAGKALLGKGVGREGVGMVAAFADLHVRPRDRTKKPSRWARYLVQKQRHPSLNLTPSSEEPSAAAWLPLDAAVTIWLPLHLWQPGNSGLAAHGPYRTPPYPGSTVYSLNCIGRNKLLSFSQREITLRVWIWDFLDITSNLWCVTGRTFQRHIQWRSSVVQQEMSREKRRKGSTNIYCGDNVRKSGKEKQQNRA